jgi:hypothetical protein
MPPSEIAVGWQTAVGWQELQLPWSPRSLPEDGCALEANTPKSFGPCGLLESWRPSMANFDYGLWVGNFIAVVLVALALTYFISLLRSVMDMDLNDLKLFQ